MVTYKNKFQMSKFAKSLNRVFDDFRVYFLPVGYTL